MEAPTRTNEGVIIELLADDRAKISGAIGERRAEINSIITRFALRDERQAVGAAINPDTAYVFFEYRGLDPYGEMTFDEDCIGRSWFAADPSVRIAVAFCDIPPR